MGCICSKGIQSDEIGDTARRGKVSRKHSLSVRRFVGASRREEVSTFEPEGLNDRDGRTRLILKPSESNIVTPIFSDEDKKIDKPRRSHQRHSTVDFVASDDHSLWVGSVSKGIEGEQVAAGWPSWLSKVAGEALKGWVPRKADSFEKLDKIGQGTYSHVYRARDLESGKIVALKKVRFVNLDLESVRFMAREIHILRRLDHPNVIKLEGLVTSRMSCSLYLVFEYMEHDLAGLAANPSIKFTEPQIKCYMQQLLRGLEHSHSRGVLHRDIKGSNLLIDNNGILRIGDYGLATFFHPDQAQPLTSRVVTLWYRPPELLLGSTSYGVAVDLWSTGCILAELFAGKPIMPGRTEVEQLHKIFKLCGSPAEDYWKKSKLPHATIFKPQHPYKRCIADTFKDIPRSAFALVDTLLAIEPADRGTALSALKSDFFGTHPLPCDPSSLPKYPPSKEFDAKLRDEARRQKATGGREREIESVGKRAKESGYLRAPDANAELQTSLQRRQGQSNPKSNSEKYNPQAEDAGSGFPIDPPRGVSRGTANGISHSGPLLHPSAWGSSWHSNKKDGMNKLQAQGGAGRVSKGLMGEELKSQRSFMPAETSHAYDNLSLRGNGYIDNQSDRGSSHNRRQKKYGQLEVAEPSEKQEWNHLLDPHDSNKKDERPDNRGAFGKKNRIHYSGPLMPPSGNLEEMLKEHERQIQQAVRKARLDKAKTKKLDGEQVQYEALLVPGRNGRSDLRRDVYI